MSVAVAALVVAACAQTRAPAPVVTAEPARARPPPASPTPAPPPVAPPIPVLPPPSSVAPAPPQQSPRIPVPPPVAPAVDALFPEPAATVATPAFAPGRTDFTRSDEVRAILGGIANAAAGSGRIGDVRMTDVGVSRGGEPIVAIAFTRQPEPPPSPAPGLATLPAAPAVPASPAAAASDAAGAQGLPPAPMRRPVVLLMSGQHGDEPAGTEALLALVERIAAGDRERILEKVDVVVLPLANPDARALLQRETAEGVDLNRDQAWLRTPEARAIAGLVVRVAPDVVVDLHEYPVHGPFADRFQALPRADVLLQTATVGNLHPFVARAAEEWFRQPLARGLQNAGYATDWYHTVAAGSGERRASMGSVQATVARNAFGLRNAVSVLVETRGADLGRQHLKRRVQAALLAADNVLASAARRGGDLVRLREFAERDIAAKACQGEAVVEAATTPSEYTLAMIDPQTGAIRRSSVAWDSALELRIVKSRPRPCGYWLAATQTEAVSRLQTLGIDVQRFDEAGEFRGEAYRELAREPALAASGPDAPPRIRVQTQPVLVDVPAGSYYVPLDQPLANLALALLEPESPASYVAAGIVGNAADVARVLQRPRARMAPAAP